VSVVLPPRLQPAELAERCREVGALERVQPYLVEKDYYLTRLLWALGQELGSKLLLKGGTLLSKVDLGFLRMSEDADMVIPEPPARNRGTNMKRVNRVRDALAELEAEIGVKRRFPSGDDFDRGAHRHWRLDYPSEFGDQSIQLEVSMRPMLRRPREVPLGQLLEQTHARCWALDADEARAEKVRAAFTREAIRDFYDLQRLLDAGFDFASPGFRKLVDAKLKELNAAPLSHQPQLFRLDERRMKRLRMSLKTELPAVLRSNAPAFELDDMLARFAALWAAPLLPR
jgi:predicted nucleotidyltransferase component of viral defense system